MSYPQRISHTDNRSRSQALALRDGSVSRPPSRMLMMFDGELSDITTASIRRNRVASLGPTNAQYASTIRLSASVSTVGGGGSAGERCTGSDMIQQSALSHACRRVNKHSQRRANLRILPRVAEHPASVAALTSRLTSDYQRAAT